MTVTNCQSDQPEVAIIEVLNTQAQNTRATVDKTYHLLISFRLNEQPDAIKLKAIEGRICDALGYGDHQRVSAVHYDTDNIHLHLAISKIHPATYKSHTPFSDYKILSRMCEKLEYEFGLEQDNHKAQKISAENRAADMEHHSGIESLIGWIKRECYDQIQSASSWAEMNKVMQANGLKLHERGNGLVITAEDGTTIKASSLGRGYSKKKLEIRLGPFKPPTEQKDEPVKKYQKRPLRSQINTVELYARYMKEQKELSTIRTVALTKLCRLKRQMVDSIKWRHKQKRTAAKLIICAGFDKKIMYTAISRSLNNNIERINSNYLKDRQIIYDTCKRQSWADWLRIMATGGDMEALKALRARKGPQRFKGDTVAGEGHPNTIHFKPYQDSVTKNGTIIYCVGDTVLRDAGDRIKVSQGVDYDGGRVALQMALERYGNRIRVNGSPEFKEQIAQTAAAANLSITFDDASLESRRQELLQQTPTKENDRSESGKLNIGLSVNSGTNEVCDGLYQGAENSKKNMENIFSSFNQKWRRQCL